MKVFLVLFSLLTAHSVSAHPASTHSASTYSDSNKISTLTKVEISDIYSQFWADFDETFTNLVFQGANSSVATATFTSLFNQYMIPNVKFHFPFGQTDLTGITPLAEFAVSLILSGVDSGEFHCLGMPHFQALINQ